MTFAAAPIVGLYLFLLPAPSPQEVDLDSLRLAHAMAQTRVGELMSLRDSALSWAESRYRAIADARRQGDDALRDALRAAQVAADSLGVLDTRLAAAMDAGKRARIALAAALESNLEFTLIRAELEDAQRTKAELLARARALAIELTRVQEPLELPATDVPRVSVEPADGPEEIQLKADFLADRAAQLRRAADVVESEVRRRTKRAELQTEMRRLVAEVNLFDQARVPPAGAQATEPLSGARESGPGLATEQSQAEDAREGASSPLAPLSERGVDLPGSTGPGATAGRGRGIISQLQSLRASLLLRAEALEARAEEIRAMLRGPP